MHYDILHELPGRMRIHCRNLRLNPDSKVELCRWVAEHEELISASLSTRTSNILIVYSDSTERERILGLLDELQLFGVASIGPEDASPLAELTGVAMAACLRETTNTVLKALLPTPLANIRSGWRKACICLDAADKLSNRELVNLIYIAGKTLLFTLLGAILPARFILAIAFSLIEHVFPDLKPKQREIPSQIEAVPVAFEMVQAAI